MPSTRPRGGCDVSPQLGIALMEGVHRYDEEERGEGATLLDAPSDREYRGKPAASFDGSLGPRDRLHDEGGEWFWYTNPAKGG